MAPNINQMNQIFHDLTLKWIWKLFDSHKHFCHRHTNCDTNYQGLGGRLVRHNYKSLWCFFLKLKYCLIMYIFLLNLQSAAKRGRFWLLRQCLRHKAGAQFVYCALSACERWGRVERPGAADGKNILWSLFTQQHTQVSGRPHKNMKGGSHLVTVHNMTVHNTAT